VRRLIGVVIPLLLVPIFLLRKRLTFRSLADRLANHLAGQPEFVCPSFVSLVLMLFKAQ